MINLNRNAEHNNRFFIADTHFGDKDIIAYENRPFKNVEEMNKAMADAWNITSLQFMCKTESNYSPEFYVLGDFSNDRVELEEISKILSNLGGKKYLVKGNHDIYTNDEYRSAGFDEVYDKPILIDNFYILSHEPIYVNSNMPYFNIFGHVHNNPIYKNFSEKHFCVSAERIGYKPISLNSIVDIITNFGGGETNVE